MIELNILYWNTFKNQLIEEILELVSQHKINFIILLENTANDLFLINSLKNINSNFRLYENVLFKKTKIISCIEGLKITEKSGHGRYGIYLLEAKNSENTILTVTHFPSKINYTPTDYLSLCIELKDDIEKVELIFETKNTIIIGDFNMNPFEDGLISSKGLHNINNKEIALTKTRNYNSRAYSFFYNPMWNFLGEKSKGTVQGTHFYNSYRPINHFWNMYDQVMIRPELISNFDENKLDIISSINDKPLLHKKSQFTVINKNISDHLPIKLQIKLKKIEDYGKFMAK